MKDQPDVKLSILTVEDAADAHPALTKAMIRGGIQRGELRATKRGRRYWIAPEALEEWLCPESGSQPVSIKDQTPASGSSETEPSAGGQATAMASIARLKKRSGNTSKRDRPSGELVQLNRVK
ncbi:MAG: helix-turn-helix domain-containing protein [Pseudomonadota bacterium]